MTVVPALVTVVTAYVNTADCSHRVCESSWVCQKFYPDGFTKTVTTVSCGHRLCDHSQLAAVTTFVIPFDCSHGLGEYS